MSTRQYATCRKCGDPIERGDQRQAWCSLRSQPWPHSCTRPWWRAAVPHEPGREILTGDAATAAWLAHLYGERTQPRRRRWQLSRIWRG